MSLIELYCKYFKEKLDPCDCSQVDWYKIAGDLADMASDYYDEDLDCSPEQMLKDIENVAGVGKYVAGASSEQKTATGYLFDYKHLTKEEKEYLKSVRIQYLHIFDQILKEKDNAHK